MLGERGRSKGRSKPLYGKRNNYFSQVSGDAEGKDPLTEMELRLFSKLKSGMIKAILEIAAEASDDGGDTSTFANFLFQKHSLTVEDLYTLFFDRMMPAESSLATEAVVNLKKNKFWCQARKRRLNHTQPHTLPHPYTHLHTDSHTHTPIESPFISTLVSIPLRIDNKIFTRPLLVPNRLARGPTAYNYDYAPYVTPQTLAIFHRDICPPGSTYSLKNLDAPRRSPSADAEGSAPRSVGDHRIGNDEVDDGWMFGSMYQRGAASERGLALLENCILKLHGPLISLFRELQDRQIFVKLSQTGFEPVGNFGVKISETALSDHEDSRDSRDLSVRQDRENFEQNNSAQRKRRDCLSYRDRRNPLRLPVLSLDLDFVREALDHEGTDFILAALPYAELDLNRGMLKKKLDFTVRKCRRQFNV